MLRGTVCNEDEAAEHDALWAEHGVSLYRRGMRNHKADEPTIRLSGPTKPILLPDDVRSSSHHAMGFGHNYRA